jgi:DNA-directed RNA polymerase subunit RPC12/RpoP
MTGSYRCLSCGPIQVDDGDAPAGNVMKCPKCGRDAYRSRETAPTRTGPTAGHPGGIRPVLAIPSRYAGAVGAGGPPADEAAEEVNLIVPHTPFVVILGLIFAFVLPPAGLIISIVGLRLANESAKGVRGRELAIAGIALGSVMTVLLAILILSGK